MKISRVEIKQIIRRFDVDGSGSLDYNEFMKLLGYTPNSNSNSNSNDSGLNRPALSRSTSNNSSNNNSNNIDDLIEKIRKQLEEKLGSSLQAARKLKSMFAEYDHNGDGKISEIELTTGFDGLKVSCLQSLFFL